jgi:hypothetical protein
MVEDRRFGIDEQINMNLDWHVPILEKKRGLPADRTTVPYIHSRQDGRDDQ